MFEAVYTSGTSLTGLQKQQEVISHNLAHVNSIGFRRNVPAFEHFVQDPDRLGSLEYGHGVSLSKPAIDFSQGQIKQTGRSLDVSISGDGFFVLQGPNGNVLTRNGVFFRSPQGTLINSEGTPVLGENGPIAIDPNIGENEIKIDRSGQILAHGESVAKLQIKTVENKSLLARSGEFSFALGDSQMIDSDATVLQNSREQANVSAVSELVNLIAASRHYEAATRSIRAVSEALEQSINS